MAVKTFAAWSARAREIGINDSRAAYQGYLNNIGAKEPSAPASSVAATNIQRAASSSSSSSGGKKAANKIYTSEGKEYTPQVNGNMLPGFRDNPNRDYEGLGEIVQGKVGGYRVDDRSKLRIYMTKTGRRGIEYEGNYYYEISPGSGSFRSVVGKGEGGTLELADLGANKANSAAEAAAAEESSGGGSGSGSSGGSGTVDEYVKESETKVDERVVETEDIAAEAKTEIAEKATTFPGAPDWVNSPEDYENWLRSKSAKSGFASTVKTSPTGLNPTLLTEGVKVTSLSG